MGGNNKKSEKGSVPKKSKKGEQPIDRPLAINEIFPIVGIGASAGGLEALKQLFSTMPADTGMAFVVIQHLDPNHPGVMPELLQSCTAMPVRQATDQLQVKPNHVYVIPPNRSMTLVQGLLNVYPPLETKGIRLPIDLFFRSLAEYRKEKSIGIILSGMGSDGCLGLQAIKESDGTVLIQDPATAKFDGMPCSAIATDMVDIVADAQALPGKLLAFLRYLPSASQPDEPCRNMSHLEKIIRQLNEVSGHDFSLYKKNTLLRRIERRKGIHKISRIDQYMRFLSENPGETEILFKELLIGVTAFFRDSAVWDYLKERILPEIIKQAPNGYLFRAWVPACSTGEEAYSLAIVFAEVMQSFKKQRNISLQIFATDLDVDAIDKARKGYFLKNIAGDVNETRLQRYFVPEGDGYRISSSIREMVVFAPQNVIKDPPFTKLDILSCRNMLIYMEPELQRKLIALFNYSLNPGGIMILGTAETLGLRTDIFHELDSKLKIFKSNPTIRAKELVDFPSSFHQKRTKVNIEDKKFETNSENIQVVADQIILQKYAPPSVLVNEKGDIVYIAGRTGKFLEPVAGKANWNIHAMAREGLQQLLPNAFRTAAKSFDPVVLNRVKIGSDEQSVFVHVVVQRIEKPDNVKGMFMVVFNEISMSDQSDNIQRSGKAGQTKRVKELEMELQRSYRELQTTREDMQTSQEEMKSINEELQSTNEELQSTNEELTTSKEEMQSLNEELQTVNAELQSKISDFSRANDDMKNLLNSTEIATLFLDKELNIRRYTDQVTSIFKLRNSDIGRPFTDLVTNLHYPEIGQHARQVIKTLNFKETTITTNDNRWFMVRIMPYRTLDDRIDGLVMTFIDITAAKKLEIDLLAANEALTKTRKE